MLGDFYCRDIKRNMDELCRDEVVVDDVEKVVDDVTTEVPDNLNEVDVDESPPNSSNALTLNSFMLIPVIMPFVIHFRL